MPKHDIALTQMATAVFAQQTERDKQIKIGASNFSQACNRCLAEDMTGVKREPSSTWLAPVIGTAVHELAERRLNEPGPLRDMFGEPLVEAKLVLGEIEGYGTVKSTTDLYVPNKRLVWDFKTTDQGKLKDIDAAVNEDPDPDLYTTNVYKKMRQTWYKLNSYLNQLNSYGRGLELAGYEVESMALAFVCRDGKTADHIKVYKFDYDRAQADRVWGRVELMWQMLTEGHEPDTFSSHEDCWYCNNRR